MKNVTIYTRSFCGYCVKAKSVLKKKKANVKEINAGMDAQLKAEMIRKSGGGTTFPQIFIGDMHIGGCDEMLALDRAGKLDALLKA